MMGTQCPKHVESDRQINIFEKISASSWFTIHMNTRRSPGSSVYLKLKLHNVT
jgi:hypothetical protein